jgi:arylsulfatase
MARMNRRAALNLIAPAVAAIPLHGGGQSSGPAVRTSGKQPNVLILMTDQQRFDTIAELGNRHIYTPNMDRLVRRGVTFTNAYSSCPVCVPARYTIRTGCEPPTTRIFSNSAAKPAEGQAATMTGRCGAYLAQTMRSLGYRTFGIGKFHTTPAFEDLGFDVHLHSEELYGTPEHRRRDAYASWIATHHVEYDFVEALMGERTEMYYMPQMSPLPADCGVEHWAADRAVEQIRAGSNKPYFGFVSFIGPHPPFAPPLPFNRMYDPDRMPNPVRGSRETDHMDAQIPWMNYMIWAEDINDPHARTLKARYYGEISYIDGCIGRILDAVEKRGDSENTLICFFSDHGDHLGDHGAWQKETFFDASCHVPFVVSWPSKLAAGTRSDALAALTDLFGIATKAAGKMELRQGSDLLGVLDRSAAPREYLYGYYGEPGTPHFKIMVRRQRWKYIHFSNGGGEQLFDLHEDPNELRNLAADSQETAAQMRLKATAACDRVELRAALASGELRKFPFAAHPLRRIYQFDRSRGVTSFPARPQEVLAQRR